MASRITPSQGPGATPTPVVALERVARLAYEKWCRRGCPHGSDKQDWYEAEAELLAEQGRGAAVPPRR